ncbi:MAG: ABC transporter ATP-binding protein [Opitutaceae bacterium]|nr:ABC transporter ATP-binding protein [Opitutaceae bacterium]
MSTYAVEVRNLRKSYGLVEAVKGVCFSVQANEIFGLLGPNGAGKTSTLECLVGLRVPDSGELWISGLDARADAREVKGRIGVALQSTSLQDKLTPREALALFASFHREHEDVVALLERFGLAEKADVAFESLSGGQRQRLALALAFVNRPEVLIFDEPTMGLDPRARQELHDEILGMKAAGHTILLSTHHLDEAEKLCDRIAIIDRGVVIATGAPRDLIAGSQAVQMVSVRCDRSVPRDWFEQLPDAREISGSGAEFRFVTTAATPALAELTRRLAENRVGIVELQVRKASLEDVFLRLTSGGNP